MLSLAVMIALPGRGEAQTPDGAAGEAATADGVYERARLAEEAELWERAVELYNEGERLFPGDTRFPWALGNLYFHRQLYRLAWDEYRLAEKGMPFEPDLLFMLSRTAAYLNEDRVSASYLEKLLNQQPDNREAIGNLGWMYYKIHRLRDGERLLVRAIETLGPSADFAMTLGTIYADLFRYGDSKKWYLEAIAGAESTGDRLFASVAHYNLSILESRFYKFALAFERTNKSLESLNRASGRLARGELLLRRLEIDQALADYQAAYEMDTSPLSKVNLAQTYQVSGRLEEARLYAENCLAAEDESWMLNYGIDPVRYRRDLHEILMKVYEGLEKTEGFLAWAGPAEKARSLSRAAVYRFKAAVHRLLFRKHSLLAGRAYGRDASSGGAPHLDALTQFYHAFAAYPGRSAGYLRRARAIEEPLIPESAGSYGFEEGKTRKNLAALTGALEAFDPQWERDMLADTFTAICAEAARKGRREEGRDAAERLYALNAGALRQKGIRLPAVISVEAASPRAARTAERLARKAGISKVSGAAPPRYRLTLAVDKAAGSVRCELRDEGRGRVVVTRVLPLGKTARERAAFSRALSDALFVK
ncbi:MAG: tetratricopeptide repeat family protein [Treponematales bacterium]